MYYYVLAFFNFYVRPIIKTNHATATKWIKGTDFVFVYKNESAVKSGKDVLGFIHKYAIFYLFIVLVSFRLTVCLL